METVAMYWEPKIKTYGFQVVKSLALYRYVIPVNLSIHWDRAIECIERGPDRFHLVCGHLNQTLELSLSLIGEPDQGKSFSRRFDADIPMLEGCRGVVTAPVELLYFQGPHFGDRFGIADFTYRALNEHAHGLLAAVFSCASVYLVLPAGAADRAREQLTAAFTIPG